MTSTRSQNVSILPHPSIEPWEPSIVTYNGTERVHRSTTRHNPFRTERTTYRSPTESFDFYPRDSPTQTNLLGNSSSQRELSPVRWCDQEVDGVYLGKSGWVQVQQPPYSEDYFFDGSSSLPCRKHASNSQPVNLPPPLYKRERPSKFYQDFDSVSPPSVTPIISPPPAFKDDRFDVQFFQSQTPYETYELPQCKHRSLYRHLHTHSLEGTGSRQKKRSPGLPGFRSLDSTIGNHNDETNSEDEEYNQRYNAYGDRERFASKYRSRNHHQATHKTRSSSSDSSSVDSAKGSRRKVSQEYLQGEDCKDFCVKRSKSWQLPDRNNPNESMFKSQSSSGKSWDPMPMDEGGNLPFGYSQRPQPTLVTVTGETIPVGNSQQSLSALNKITTSKEEQMRLISESEEEVKIISDFITITRSRTAARNLLKERCVNQLDFNIPEEYDYRYTSQSCTSTRPSTPPDNKEFFSNSTLAFLLRNFLNPHDPPPKRKSRHHHHMTTTPDKHRNDFPMGRNRKREEEEEEEYQSSSMSSSSSYEDICQRVTSSSNLKPYVGTMDRYSRGGSAPENDDSGSAGIDQRSLSLPRSFLSEHYRPNHKQKNSGPSKQETTCTVIDECPDDLQKTRTAPTTPIRELRQGRDKESSKRHHNIKSSCTSLSDESGFMKPSRHTQKISPDEKSHSRLSLNDNFRTYKNPPRNSDSLTNIVVEKFRKNLSLKIKGSTEGLDRDTETSTEGYPITNGSVYGPQGFEPKTKHQNLGFLKKRSMGKRGFRNEKYDSHDSGIQMIHRGNIDSSESQDTDLQEDIDSPLSVKRQGLSRFNENFCRPQSEIFNQVLFDKFKADLQWRTKAEKHKHGKGVRRTNSDLGGQRLYNWDVKNNSRRFGSQASSVKGSHGRNPSRPFTQEEWETLRRLYKPGLRRSLSQPLGLNELPTFVRRRSSTLKALAMSEDEKYPRERTSEDEFMSDSESSVMSISDRKRLNLSRREEAAILAEAVWDHVAMESCELPFRAGDVIEVLDTRDKDWWWGVTNNNNGYFPSAFVRLRVSQEDTVEDCLAAMAKGKAGHSQLRRGKSVSLLSNDQVRSSVVRELLNTERDFVKVLRDVKEGYVIPCKRRKDMFTAEQIATIFSNLEDLLLFQEKFLKDLEARIDRKYHKSCIGEVFLNHSSGFRIYSEYCNAHPMAIATLQELYQKPEYCQFFETCRLKQNLIEIPLDGYLLTPVQRICKYPLQLAELLKYTKSEHPDYKNVQEALDSMKKVATLINERKRKMESLEKLASWQQRVDGWEGEDLIELSSRLIHQGDVIRISTAMWTTTLTLFLFDHQIIYCKKDLLKRDMYTYKGRILLKESVVIDLPDGKNPQLGVTIKNGLKISNRTKEKWLLFCCRSKEDKAKWLEALEEEKRYVAQEKEVDLDLPPAAKQLAKMAARTKKSPPYKPRGKRKLLRNHEEILLRRNHPETSKSKSSRKVGNWFTFGGVGKNSKANLTPRPPIHEIT